MTKVSGKISQLDIRGTIRHGGFSWSSFWATLISATVEDAAPTHVVLTFPTAKPALGTSDFTIAGFTISSASWTGAVLTLVLAETVVFGDLLVVTFVKTGGTANVTNNTVLATPSGLTLTLISGGVKIDWTDNTGGLAQTEIWGKNDSDAYALLYTIAAGTVTKSEITPPVDLRYYKIRAKIGSDYSEFTAEQSIAMLGPELIDQINWATAAYWVSPPAGYTFDGIKISHSVADIELMRIVDPWVWPESVVYQRKFTLTGSGHFIPPYIGSGPGDVTAPGSFIMNYTATAYQYLYLGSWSFVGDITALSIKKVLFP